MTDAKQKRIEDLQRKLEARRGKPGFEGNAKAIQEEIDRLEAGGAL